MSYNRKRSTQSPTFISLVDVAASQKLSGMWFASRWNILKGLIPASSQVSSGASSSQDNPMDFNRAGFWLATIEQVQDAEFLQTGGIGLIVCLLGEHSRRPKYPPGTVWKSFSVMFESRRDWDLQHVLPSIVSALSQARETAMQMDVSIQLMSGTAMHFNVDP
jgi:hypothetical protein